MAFDLSQIRRTSGISPPRFVIYGENGLGKSTFATQTPSPIFIMTEDGAGSLEFEAFPQASSFLDVLDQIATLTTNEHEFKTVVIDTIDSLEPLIWDHVCQQHNVQGIEDFGYGKGYTYALDAWRLLLGSLDALRAKKGMLVLLVCHSQIVREEPPTGESYTKYEFRLHKRAAALVSDWADAVFYCEQEIATKDEDEGFNRKRTRAITNDQRILQTQPSPAYNAKNRYGLPPTLPLAWPAVYEALQPVLEPEQPTEATA